MHRQIVYPGQIPLDTDMLNSNKDAYLAISKLAQGLFGNSTIVNGLTCVPNTPAALNVIINPGEIYSVQQTDASAYGSLGTDTNNIVKQGILATAQTLSTPAPGTAGFSINYLIEAQYVGSDANSVVLPYYNANNPSVAWSGPNNTGTAQNTQRQDLCQVQVKAGTAATTGTQVTPSPDAGWVGLWVVTVANGQSTVTSSNIVAYTGAPFLHGPNGDPLFVINNYIATTDPTASNDNTQGYGVVSRWLNTTNNNLWICENASTGAAVWVCVSNNPSNTNNFFVDPCCRVAQIGTSSPPSISTSKKYGVVDLVQMWVSGGTVSAGTITQDATGTYGGRTPYACLASGVTTGAGASINARRWLESADAQNLQNLICTLSCKVTQNTGASQNVALQINKATAANNFSSTTNIGTSSGTSVASGVPTTISYTLNLGACGNGIEAIVICPFSSQTLKNFAVTDWCINIGTQVVNFAVPEFAVDLADTTRYYEQSYEYGTNPGSGTNNGMTNCHLAAAIPTSIGIPELYVRFLAIKAISPTITIYSPNSGSSGNIFDQTASADKAATVGSHDTKTFSPSNNSGGTLSDGDALRMHWTADARL